ncbi:MAG: hypothetical protein FWE72_09690 [Spirochaetaceae bacterium]|nr:hypothetical protein [Spirochaetaceae bacterium]
MSSWKIKCKDGVAELSRRKLERIKLLTCNFNQTIMVFIQEIPFGAG